MNRFLLSSLSFLLCLPAIPALALPGEAAAVISHCGAPQSEHIGTSNVTNRIQRDLMYDNVTLHFVPDGAGWSFTTAWRGHFPVTRTGLESTMPCFRDALAAAAARPLTPIDPTIARETNSVPISASGFGVPHLGLIAILAMMLLMLTLWPRRRAAVINELPSARRLRKPGLPTHIRRRWSGQPPTR